MNLNCSNAQAPKSRAIELTDVILGFVDNVEATRGGGSKYPKSRQNQQFCEVIQVLLYLNMVVEDIRAETELNLSSI